MKSLGKAVRTARADGVPWRLRLNEFLRAYRAAPHSSTGVAPCKLLLRNANTSRLPESASKFIPNALDLFARKNDERNKALAQKHADSRNRAKEHEFSIGASVLLRRRVARKGETRFEESPYTIKTVNGNMIEASNGHKTVCRNASEFKRFVPARADVNRTSARRTPVVFDQRKTDDDEDDFEWTINTATVTAEVPAVDPPIAPLPPAEPPVDTEPIFPRRNCDIPDNN